MQLSWPHLLLLLLLLLQLADVTLSVPLSRRWSGFNNHYSNFKPFKPKRARFAAPMHGFSNIFQNHGIDRWANGALPAMPRTAWSNYPVAPTRLQPIPLARNHYQSFAVPRPSPAPVPPRRHQFVPASNIQRGKVPTHFMTDAELHGLVCVPASSLASALAGHQDQVTHHRDGSVTTHQTVLAGTDGGTSHSTRITSGGASTVVETRTNSSSGVQQHRQSVQRTAGSGVVRSSTGSAFSGGRPGLPTLADVITSSSSEGSNSQSRASASGYDVTGQPLPARSISHSVSSGLGGSALLPQLPQMPQMPQINRPALHPAQPAPQALQIESRSGVGRSSRLKDTPPEVTEDSSEEYQEDGSEEEPFSSEDSSEQEDASFESEDAEPSELEEEAPIKQEDGSASFQTDDTASPSENNPVSTQNNADSSTPKEKTPSQREEEDDDEGSDVEEGNTGASSDDDASKQLGKQAKPGTKEGE